MRVSNSRGRRFGWRAWSCGLTIVAVSTLGVAAGAATKKPTVPAAPTIISVKADVRAVRVRFQKPASNGGAKITSYKVKCTSSDGGKAGSRAGVKSPITVVSLSKAKSYKCTVTARNNVGKSAPSAPSAPVVTLAR